VPKQAPAVPPKERTDELSTIVVVLVYRLAGMAPPNERTNICDLSDHSPSKCVFFAAPLLSGAW
jgi:hypothetical protein